MFNWAIVVTYNNLELTKQTIESLRRQTIPVHILAIDNGSTDNTVPWLRTQQDVYFVVNTRNNLARAWNGGLQWLFRDKWAMYVLVVNNDVVLRPDTYAHLLADGGGFVTAVGSHSRDKIENLAEPDPAKKRPHPDFSCFLIRRNVFELVGPFNEKFEGAYCEDADYHLRMHKAGVRAESLDLPFWHVDGGANTVKNADGPDALRIMAQADQNRELFKQMYGCAVGSPEYYALFGHGGPENAA